MGRALEHHFLEPCKNVPSVAVAGIALNMQKCTLRFAIPLCKQTDCLAGRCPADLNHGSDRRQLRPGRWNLLVIIEHWNARRPGPLNPRHDCIDVEGI
jgi:hypothetical protein